MFFGGGILLFVQNGVSNGEVKREANIEKLNVIKFYFFARHGLLQLNRR